MVSPPLACADKTTKTANKIKAGFDPLLVNFRRPVIDFLQRGTELRRHVVAVECATYPPVYRRPPLSGDDVIIEMDADDFPVMPEFLRRVRSSASIVTVTEKESER